MSSFSLRFDGFWWSFLAGDFGFFFGWGVGSARCICLHWRRVRSGLHRERRRLREEIKKRALLRHVSKRGAAIVFNYSKRIHIFHPTPVQLNWELLWSWEFAGKRCCCAEREEEDRLTSRDCGPIGSSVYPFTLNVTHRADVTCFYFHLGHFFFIGLVVVMYVFVRIHTFPIVFLRKHALDGRLWPLSSRHVLKTLRWSYARILC